MSKITLASQTHCLFICLFIAYKILHCTNAYLYYQIEKKIRKKKELKIYYQPLMLSKEMTKQSANEQAKFEDLNKRI